MNIIDVATLHGFIENSKLKEGIILVDVRRKDEWLLGSIEGAIHIPLDALHETDFSKMGCNIIIFQCRSGVRSIAACEIVSNLVSKDVKLYSLTGGILAWNSAGYSIIMPEE